MLVHRKEHQERDSCYLKLREMSRQQVLTYPFGVIVFLRNLHPEATKSSIHSFLTRCVEKYKSRKPNKSKEGILVNSPQDFTIDYIDYKPKCGFDTAHARVKTSENAQLLVHALKKRKRVMGRGDDYKGRKSKADGNFVTGEVIIGDRERIYWEGVLTKAKSRKLSWGMLYPHYYITPLWTNEINLEQNTLLINKLQPRGLVWSQAIWLWQPSVIFLL